jgi:DNA-directed RNA polymerase subunit RPC12/RpoP
MVKWVCTKCNFRFESSKGNDCPYCGRKEFVEKELSAQEVLDDVDEVLNR